MIMTPFLTDLLAGSLPAGTKGLPVRAYGRPLGELGALGLNLLDGDLPFPVAVLRQTALDGNSAWMASFTQRMGVSLCPHGKTTMAPQLFAKQLGDGCWGITVATVAQMRVCADHGVPRILMANQVVGDANIDIMLDTLAAWPDLDFYTLIDSEEGLRLLEAALAARPGARPLQVLLEIGAPGARTGVRTLAEALALGRAIRDAAPAIRFRGVEAYEGILHGENDGDVERRAADLMHQVRRVAGTGLDEAWFGNGEVLLSAGGSALFDIAARELSKAQSGRPLRVVLRSGCYLTHDVAFYARHSERLRERSPDLAGQGEGLENALEVWSVVQSVPEAQRAICMLGKRDISHDMDLPQPLVWFRRGAHVVPQAVPSGIRVTALNDQHAYLDSEDAPVPFRVGDMIGFGISHPCTTFDKWSLIQLVDDTYRVTGGIRTFF